MDGSAGRPHQKARAAKVRAARKGLLPKDDMELRTGRRRPRDCWLPEATAAGLVLRTNWQLPAGHQPGALLDSSGISDSERSPEGFKENHVAVERTI
jgi:hypothetical protein